MTVRRSEEECVDASHTVPFSSFDLSPRQRVGSSPTLTPLTPKLSPRFARSGTKTEEVGALHLPPQSVAFIPHGHVRCMKRLRTSGMDRLPIQTYRVYVYIYIYREREIEKERDRERERVRTREIFFIYLFICYILWL